MSAPLARVVRTCTSCPSQWDAWTVDGQYLYLRYRFGKGTVDAYNSSDSDAWTRIPDGAGGSFGTDDPWGGSMYLPEFLAHAGLVLVPGADVVGEPIREEGAA